MLLVEVFSSHHQFRWLHLQASNFDELMTGEPVTSRHSTSMIGLMFLAHLSSELLHQDCSIRPQSSLSITPYNTIIGKASISLLCLILVAWMQLTSVAMSILPELLWLIFSCGLLRPCGYYNKATQFWCRSFAAFTYHDLLRPRCYSNEVTHHHHIVDGLLCSRRFRAFTHHHSWWKSSVSLLLSTQGRVLPTAPWCIHQSSRCVIIVIIEERFKSETACGRDSDGYLEEGIYCRSQGLLLLQLLSQGVLSLHVKLQQLE